MSGEGSFHDSIAETHAEWRELCALAMTDVLTAEERARLEAHLGSCAECREVSRQYSMLAHEGLPALAGTYSSGRPNAAGDTLWDHASARERMLSAASFVPNSIVTPLRQLGGKSGQRFVPVLAWAGIAAALVLAIAVGYRLGRHTVPQTVEVASAAPVQSDSSDVANQKAALSLQLSNEAKQLKELEANSGRSEQQVKELQTKLDTLDQQSAQQAHEKAAEDQNLTAALADRDALQAKLRDSQQNYESVQAQLTQLRTQRQQDLLHYASLDVEVMDLTHKLHDAEGRVKDDTQYLASDRDIRELMGARQLYIADVMDVAQNGEPRKPFGRVFYTKNKSLIFYAFDLDKQPGLKTASTFQAWAREGSDNAKPVSLGIFYMDSETNRRWVLKTDDPKALAEINAVFVTAEPKGGSQKPTGRQLLYAYLRSVSPNHP